jgi:hypothetical protein
MAPWPMAAAVLGILRDIAGAAAALAKFLRGCAFFTVTGRARAVYVRFTARAGVFGRAVLLIEDFLLIIAGYAGDWF